MKTTVAEAIQHMVALNRLTDNVPSSKARGNLKRAGQSIAHSLYDAGWPIFHSGRLHSTIALDPEILTRSVHLRFTETQRAAIINDLPSIVEDYEKTAHANWGWSEMDSMTVNNLNILNHLTKKEAS